MKLLILASVVALSGCFVTPVKRTFPDAVPALKERCQTLMQIEGTNVSITDMLKTVVQNYNTYYQCANKVDGWNDWYTKQKEIFDKANLK